MSAKPAKPPTFDGTDTSRPIVLAWIFDVKQYLTLTDTPEDKQTKFAASYLAGVAKTWYITTYADKETTPSLKDFLDAFKKYFSSPTETQDVFSSLEKLRQGSRAANEYVTEFKLLAAQLKNPDLEYIQFTFLRGLNRKLAEAVVNDIETKDELDEICVKTLKKAAITELVNAIHPSEFRRSNPAYSPSRSASATTQRLSPAPRSSNTSKAPQATGGRKPMLLKLTDEERVLLSQNNGCFKCRKINAGHMSYDCPEEKRGESSRSTGAVKKEEVSIVDGYVVRRPVSPSELESESDFYSPIPIITIPTRIQRAVVSAGVDSGASVNVISPHVVKEHKLIEQPALPVRIHQALDPDGSTHNTKVVSTVTLSEESWTSTQKHEFTIAPLSNHDALLGMPFFARENILVDPANRLLIFPNKSIEPSSVPDGYTKVGNAFMRLVPESDNFTELNELLDKEYDDVLLDNTTGREGTTPIGFLLKHRLAVNKSGMAYMKLPTEEELKQLEREIRTDYQDVFSDELPNKPPPTDGPKHRIILKDEKKLIKGRMMRVPNKYLKAFKQWIDEHVKAGRLVPSKSHISSGTFLVPKKDPNAFLRVVHDYRALNENTVKDHTPVLRQEVILEHAVNARVRGKIDFISAYYQHLMFKGDRHKTAILTPWGLFEWTVMP